jgi:hypothetical protein
MKIHMQFFHQHLAQYLRWWFIQTPSTSKQACTAELQSYSGKQHAWFLGRRTTDHSSRAALHTWWRSHTFQSRFLQVQNLIPKQNSISNISHKWQQHLMNCTKRNLLLVVDYYVEQEKKKNSSNNRQIQFIQRNKRFINDNQISMLQNDLTKKMQR